MSQAILEAQRAEGTEERCLKRSAAGAISRRTSTRSSRLAPEPLPGLDAAERPPPSAPAPGTAGPIGVEFMHIPDPERRALGAGADGRRRRRRSTGTASSKQLMQADLFEQVLQARYLGTKRYSLEGVDALIPLLDRDARAARRAPARAGGRWR